MATIKHRYAPDIENYKYLIHPIKTNVQITEGFLYSEEERNIHGFYFHKGIDYACPWGTPVYASASGYAVASYHRFTLLNKDKTPKLYKDLPISLGTGYFVQIYHPKRICGISGGRITQYANLSKITKGLKVKTQKPIKANYEKEIVRKNNKMKKFKKSQKELDVAIQKTKALTKKYPWIKKLYGFSFSKDIKKKESYLYTPAELKSLYSKKSPYVKWVKQGEVIGYTGTSGLIHGKLNYRENSRKPNVKEYEIWDEVHLHFEEAQRDWKTGKKVLNRDPYGIYLSKMHYKDPSSGTLFKDFEKNFLL